MYNGMFVQYIGTYVYRRSTKCDYNWQLVAMTNGDIERRQFRKLTFFGIICIRTKGPN